MFVYESSMRKLRRSYENYYYEILSEV